MSTVDGVSATFSTTCVDLPDGGRLADQAEAPVAGRLLGSRVAAGERRRCERLGDDLADLLLLERLLEVVEGAQLDRLDRALRPSRAR